MLYSKKQVRIKLSPGQTSATLSAKVWKVNIFTSASH